MKNSAPTSPAAVSLVGTDAPPRAPLATLDDLDPASMESLVRTLIEQGKISQWGFLLPWLVFMGWQLGSIAGVIPSGLALVSLAVTGFYGLGVALPYFWSRRRFREECAALGLSKAQTKLLRLRLRSARLTSVPFRKRINASTDERVAWAMKALESHRPRHQLPPR